MAYPISSTAKTALARERLRRHWSQMYVATQIGVKSNTYATWELGVRRPPLRMAMALATLYETPVEDLFPLEEAN